MACTDLERRNKVGSLEEGQLADLVNDGGNLGVGGSGGLGGLPSP